MTPNQQIVFDTFTSAGLDPIYGLACAEHESRWGACASATDPRDLARGGSFGLFQISLKTAKSLDPRATPELLCHPQYNARLAADLTWRNTPHVQALPSDTEAYVRQLYMLHNAGRIVAHPNAELQEHCDDLWSRYLHWQRLAT